MSKMLHTINSHDGGMVTAFPVTILNQERGFARRLYNMDFTAIPGVIRKRRGTTSVLPPVGETVKGAYALREEGLINRYVAAHGNSVSVVNGEGWADISPVGWDDAGADYCDFVTQGGRIIVSDGVNTPFMWDGTTTTELTEMPKGRFVCEHLTRIFTAGMDDDPLAIRSCHPGDPTVWDFTDNAYRAMLLYTGNDQPITSLVALDDYILIGTTQGLYALVGRTTADFSVFRVDPNVGIGSHQAAKLIRGAIFFPDMYGNIYVSEAGSLPEKISTPIQNYIKNVDLDHISRTRAMVYNHDQYVISLPTSATNRMTFVFDTVTGRWREWSLPVGEVLPFAQEPGVAFTRPAGDQFYCFDLESLVDEDAEGETPVDDPINAFVETLEIHFGAPKHEKEIHSLWLGMWVPDHTVRLTVECRINAGEWQSLTPRDVVVRGNEGDYQQIQIPVGSQARLFQVKISNAEPDEDLPLLDMVVNFSIKELE